MSTVAPTNEPGRRGCLFYGGRVLKGFGVVLVTLVLLGVVYQTVATELDKHNYAPHGELYSVNGHLMHMVCMGEQSEGSPTVVLQAGLTAESLWWYRIQNQLAQHTQVCAYDRPGLGWSEPTSTPHDALTIVSELHTLLDQAGIAAPYVMAGHSYGAIFTRIYATKYSQEVAGIVLVDSGLVTPQQFASQGEFDQWKRSNDALQLLLWGIYRTGLKRLSSSGDFQKAGYPPEIAPEIAALQSSNHAFDAAYAESVPAFLALTEASAAAKNLGNLPTIVLWASETNFMMEHFAELSVLHDEIATYSSNSVTRIVEGADHSSILGNEPYAQQVTAAILDVIAAAQTGQPLTPLP